MTGEDAARIVQSIEFVLDNKDYSDEVEEALDMAVKALRQLPNDDENYVVLWEKAQWERDVAVEQLEKLGYSLGEKIRISEDCISRAQALHACCDEWNKDYKAIMKSIRQLPSVTPQQTRWIPVSERLPEERNHYLVTIEIDAMNGCKPYYEIQPSWYSDKQFVVEYKGDGLVAKKSVIAWMPLPEPYKTESEDKE